MFAFLNHSIVRFNIQETCKLENNILGNGQSKNPKKTKTKKNQPSD